MVKTIQAFSYTRKSELKFLFAALACLCGHVWVSKLWEGELFFKSSFFAA